MPSLDYLHKHKEFKELLRAVSSNQGILTDLVEKDYWIMHCLYSLKQQGYQFELKGGTSLSKGFNIIHRFSEDIDLRIAPPESSNVETNPKKTKPAHCESRKTYYDHLATDISIDGVHQIERDHEFDDTRYYRSGGIRLNYSESFQVSPGVKQGVLLEVGFDVVTPNIQQTISSWALDFALNNKLEVINNSAEAIPCYHPGFTFVEKLQTIATKFRQQQETENLPSNFMRHYYDVACLLEHPEVQEFIGTEDYERHKIDRFPKLDLEVPISLNEAFLLSNGETRELYRNSYEKTVALYYQDQPPFDEILAKIHEYIERF
jgi:Nucleotidyl transferase AbiEii toxin, Type IV TA system